MRNFENDLREMNEAAKRLSTSDNPGNRLVGDVLQAAAPHLLTLRDSHDQRIAKGAVDASATLFASILGLAPPEVVPTIKKYFDRSVADTILGATVALMEREAAKAERDGQSLH